MNKALLKKIIFISVAAIIVICIGILVFHSIYRATQIETETASTLTVTDSIYANGLVIRNEKLLKSDSSSGVLTYLVDNGDKVAVKDKIANIYSNEKDAVNSKNIDDLDSRISQLEKLNSLSVSNSIGIDSLDSSLNSSIHNFVSQIHNKNIINIEPYASDLTYYINERRIIIGDAKNYNDKIVQLKSERDELSNSSKGSIGSITSNFAGYFCSAVDGYENTYKVSKIKSITLKELNSIKPKDISADNYSGKIITGVSWYIACEISSENALRLTTTDIENVTVSLPFASNSTIPSKVLSVNQSDGDGNAVLVLECNYMSSDIATMRKEKLDICLNSYTGLRVSKKALHDDNVTITSTDENGKETSKTEKVQGVYTLYGSEVQFKEVSILYSGADYVICNPNPDLETLKSGETISEFDKIIVKGDNLYDGKVIK